VRALLSISGVDRTLLLGQAPHDRARYVGIGGAILLTSGMAAVSSGLAAQIGLGLGPVSSAVVGLVWGAGILSLDRWLVVSGQHGASFLQSLKLALPRLVIAVVMGLVMSMPLTLQIFSPEIGAQLAQDHLIDKQQLERDLAADPRFRSLPADRARIEQQQRELAGGPSDADVFADVAVVALRQQLADAQARGTDAETQLVCERDGSCGTARAGRGPAYEEKKARFDRAVLDVGQLQTALAAKEQEVRTRLAGQGGTQTAQLAAAARDVSERASERATEKQAKERSIDADTGLLARMEALDTLSANHPTMRTAHWALFLFLTLIECLPVLVKLVLALQKPNLYETLALAADEEARRRDQRERATAFEIAEAERAVQTQRAQDLRRDQERRSEAARSDADTHREIERQRSQDLLRDARLASEAALAGGQARLEAERRAAQDLLRDASLASDAPYLFTSMKTAAEKEIAEAEQRVRIRQRREELLIDADLRLRQRRRAAEREDWADLEPYECVARLASTEIADGPEGRADPQQAGVYRFRRRPRGGDLLGTGASMPTEREAESG